MAHDGNPRGAGGQWVDRLVSAAKWLVLPVALLLMLQWPARDVIGRFSHEADDLGQLLFALYVAVAVTCATRRGSHLATDILAHRYPRRIRSRLTRAFFAFTLLPWTLFLLVTSAPTVWRSIVEREAFPETFVAGYFVVKAAMWLLAALLLLQALATTFRRGDEEHDR
jgi:TRAP-type mannitol/chloroaromatic compound transport system permease small subunit